MNYMHTFVCMKRMFICLGSLFFLAAMLEIFAHGYRIQGFSNQIVPVALPDNVDYCGERLPMEDLEVCERLDRELTSNAYWESSTLIHLKKLTRYFPKVEAILKKYGLPEDLKYIAVAESGLSSAVSPAGAAGFWQFISETGKAYGLEINEEVDERYHFEKSTDAACRYLRDLRNFFGNWTLATAAYNCGSTGLMKCLNFQKVHSYYDLYLNIETSRYIFRIVSLKEILSHPQKYNYAMSMESGYKPLNTYKVKVDSSIANWSEWALGQGVNYKILRTLNPWIRRYTLSNKAGKAYFVELPKDKEHFVIDPLFAEKLNEEMADSTSVLHLLANNDTPFHSYTCKTGDSMEGVAKRLGTDVSGLRLWNKMKTTDKLKVGMVIRYKKKEEGAAE
ncbi:MAG: LysM peptidoglycan-binding domain-containing protein [Flavobacteriaceae bacterium]|nr:LysM peptidoglycan-binding domain-containing protein [Flavobacteriaceae bacterium]